MLHPDEEIPVVPPPPPTPFRVWRDGVLPLAIVIAGMIVIAIAGFVETRQQARQFWSSATLAPETPLPEAGNDRLVPVHTRRLSEEDSPDIKAFLDACRTTPEGAELVQTMSLDKGEWVVCLSVSDDVWQQLLATGRAPEKGAFEAIAGDLAREDHFQLDGQTFQVVGRLQRGIGGLGFAYVVRDDDTVRPFFDLAMDTSAGYIDPDGMNQEPTGEDESRTGRWSNGIGSMPRTSPFVTFSTILGLMLVALGGSWVQVRLFWYWGARTRRGMFALLNEMVDRRALFVSVHVMLYGLFFVTMLTAVHEPLANARAGSLFSSAFSSGGLQYVGAAYASGDILHAAAATFFCNYAMATVGVTLLPSLVIPMVGLFKNLLTFGVVGFVMSPIWTGFAGGYTYHSITMALELEAYIVASFAVIVLAVRAFRGIAKKEFSRQYKRGLIGIVSAALLTAVMLIMAALYEATTLILLR